MTQDIAHLRLHLAAGRDVDAEDADRLTRALRRELLELDVESVDLARAGPPPPGARAVDAMAIGTLVVTFLQSSGALAAVVGTVQAWLATTGRRSVRLELDGDVLEVRGVSSRDQQELIATWLARHEAGALR